MKISVQVRNDGASGRAICPEGSLRAASQTIPLQLPRTAPRPRPGGTVSTSVSVSEPALWSPASPSLYQLTLAVGHESSYSARVGLRQITWHGGEVYLNGQRLLLHGASIQEDALGHGDALTPGEENTIVAELRAIGANAVRTQHPLDPALLERLDAAGILVWQGIGPVEGAATGTRPRPACSPTPRARRAPGRSPTSCTRRSSPGTSSMRSPTTAATRAEVNYVQSLTRWLHAHDPTRMVAVDVWGDHPPTHPGALYQASTRSPRPTTRAGMTTPTTPPAAVSARNLTSPALRCSARSPARCS